MWVSVRTRRLSISARMRKTIESKVSAIFARDSERVASAVVYLTTAKVGRDDFEYAARIVLWSSTVGQIAVSDIGPTIRGAVGRAARRARHVVREHAKRKATSGRLARHWGALGDKLDGRTALAR